MRIYLALPEARRASYRDAVFRAAWADDRDITDLAVLSACIGDDAITRDAIAKSETDEVKAELRRSTDHAVEQGVFGVPTFVVSRGEAARELFWGQDRLDLVEEALATSV